MANINDYDILVTKSDDSVYFNLKCGYGQPCITTVTITKKDKTIVELEPPIRNNVSKYEIGSIEDLKYGKVEIYTTIEDIKDNPSIRTDISLEILMYENSDSGNSVDTRFSRRTKGKGSKFHSFYTVGIV